MYFLYSKYKFLLITFMINFSNSLFVCPNSLHNCIDNLQQPIINLQDSINFVSYKPDFDAGAHIVKASTGLLPDFDYISHMVLSANEILINNILNSELSPEIKKKLVLQVVDMTRQGDETGSIILLHYYKLIDFLL